jgi:hypothetical protein
MARFAEAVQLLSLCVFAVAGFAVGLVVGLVVTGVVLGVVGLALDPRVRGRK